MGTPSRDVTACFLEQADAQRAVDELGVLFDVNGPVPPEGEDTEPHWTVTFVLPETLGLATLYADQPLLTEVEQVVERLGGSVRDDVELDPDVLAELRSRLATPLSEWVSVDAAERDRRSRDGLRVVADDER